METPLVSRNTLRRRVRISELTDELAIGAAIRLRCDSDDIHDVVAAVVDYLIEEYPAQDLYIPASLRNDSYPVEDIKRAVDAKESVRAVCKRFQISRRTLYRLLDQEPANDQMRA